jgi:alginate O-acetyltransferase complex protein AlgI
VDVKRKTFAVEKKFNVFLAYIVFFPQLIAGPILRPHELIPQIKNLPSTNKTLIATGVLIFSIGLGKKLLLADQIAPYVDLVYANPYGATWTQWLIAFYGFPMQVYNDFSGYTDMAIGLALFFGFILPINFDRPFGAQNTSDLWRRWHMTLTNWFRDYAYYPLVKVSKLDRILKHFLAAWLVMTLVGFWHGAGLNFILWGSINGLTVAIINIMKLKKINIKLSLVIKILLTFHWFAITAILFRAENMTNAFEMFTALFSKTLSLESFSVAQIYPLLLLTIFFLSHKFDSIAYFKDTLIRYNKAILICFIFFIWTASFVFGFDHGSSTKFIYFDF